MTIQLLFLARLRERAVAALLRSEIHDHTSATHTDDRATRDELRRLFPRNERGRDHDVTRSTMLGNELLFRSEIRGTHFFRVSPLPFAGFSLVVERDKLGPHARDLFTNDGTRIERFDLSSECPSRSDCSKTGNTSTDDHDLGVRNTADPTEQHIFIQRHLMLKS